MFTLVIVFTLILLNVRSSFAENIEEPKLEDLVDVSDREDLIATGKIKPAPEFVEIDGKKVRTSPEKYESEDECDKAEQLFWYRKNNLSREINNKLNKKFEVKIKSSSFYQYILLKDYQGNLRVIGCFIDSCKLRHNQTKEEFNFVLLKRDDDIWAENNDIIGKIALAKYYSNLKGFDEKKYIFLKEKNCKVIFYKGEYF